MRTVAVQGVSAAQQELFRFLLEANKNTGLNATLRVAGGWVRDTLLCIPSHDIDMTVETPPGVPELITGEKFAASLRDYQASLNIPVHSLSVIKTNPDKSKHIETATMVVFGTPLEFCHLRSDEYCDSSRVPMTRRGTPLEDAIRRDFTVNALFYNLHTQLVEDYCGGLEDLRNGVLRCPLPPRQTFLDDPLRLLRGVRFAGQLGFAIDDSVLSSASSEILTALERKVSRERIGIEWAKMLSLLRPHMCLDYLERMGVLRAIILQEFWMKKVRGKPTTELEKTRPLCSTDDSREFALMWGLTKVLVPLVAMPDNLLYLPVKEHRVVANMFIIGASFYSEIPDDAVGEYIHAWAVNGLKQPVSTSLALRALLKAYRCACCVQLEELVVAAMQAEGQDRDHLFDMFAALADRAIPCDMLPLVIASALVAQSPLKWDSVEALLPFLEGAVEALRRDKVLLHSAITPLPIKANELPSLLGIEAKEIGGTLNRMRRFIVHHPNATTGEILAHLARR
jgi:hypothetical protein